MWALWHELDPDHWKLLRSPSSSVVWVLGSRDSGTKGVWNTAACVSLAPYLCLQWSLQVLVHLLYKSRLQHLLQPSSLRWCQGDFASLISSSHMISLWIPLISLMNSSKLLEDVLGIILLLFCSSLNTFLLTSPLWTPLTLISTSLYYWEQISISSKW